MIKNKMNIRFSISYFMVFIFTIIILSSSANIASAEVYQFVEKWGYLVDGQFDYPEKIAVDASGDVYVADTDNHRIQKFNSTGAFITKWGSFGLGDGQFEGPYAVAVNASEDVYVADVTIVYRNSIQLVHL